MSQDFGQWKGYSIISMRQMAFRAGAYFSRMHARWAVHKLMIRPPLLDPEVPDDKLAAWIDKHTMHVHQFLEPQKELPFRVRDGTPVAARQAASSGVQIEEL